MSYLKSLAIIACASLIGASAWAQGRGGFDSQRLTIRYNDFETRGAATLHLKQELLRQYPELNRALDLSLESVILIAKSQHGQGTASLRVSNFVSAPRRVYGNPRDFYDRNQRTFDQVEFYNESRDSRGVWQMDLNGNMIVREVMMVVSARRDHGGGGGGGGGPEVIRSVRCESWEYRYASCYVGPGITRVQIEQIHSNNNADCRQGSGWGHNNDSIWVSNGCRATFRVFLRAGGGGGGRPNPPPPPRPRPPRPPGRR